jgi:hypothetical protein
LLDFILAQHPHIVQDTSKSQGLTNIVLLYDSWIISNVYQIDALYLVEKWANLWIMA